MNLFVQGATCGASRGKVGLERKVRRFVQRLTREERVLIVLKRELYDDDWTGMILDLQARLKDKPYIFKLASRITEDLERIERLRKFEQENNINLSDYVEA